MALLGVDLGGTKLRLAIFAPKGELLFKESFSLEDRTGAEVGALITSKIQKVISSKNGNGIAAIGVAVPGISYRDRQTVWAPNIPGWEDYPLLQEISRISGNMPVSIDSDRTCYILGESWQGNARGCTDAIFLSVGTGIGAGILVNGSILRGAHDIAGSIGWMGLDRPFKARYSTCGCFEYHASGEGIAKVARGKLEIQSAGDSIFQNKNPEKLTALDVFEAYDHKESWAVETLETAIIYWGMAVANLVSIFNPEKIIFGGGVFGPGVQFLDAITAEAKKWAQPISMAKVRLEHSALAGDAGIYGAGFIALKSLEPSSDPNESF